MFKTKRFDKRKSPKSFEYFVTHYNSFRRRCNKCGSPVLKSDVEGYSYQCMNCDEDLYEFETYEGEIHKVKELKQLCCDVRDLLLLDEEVK
jgi:hypothetical protein